MTSSPRPELHGVRFASHNDEIEPDQSLQPIQDLTGLGDRQRDDLNPEAEQELQQLKTTLQNNIQSSRAQHHAFEPMSLPGSQPASRVHSGTSTPNRRMMMAAGSGHGSAVHSPRHSPPPSAVHSPPLTPAVTHTKDGKPQIPAVQAARPNANVITPQRSTSPPRDDKPSKETAASVHDAIPAHPKQVPPCSIGSAGSQPPSTQQSPSSTAPGTPLTAPSSESSATQQSKFRFGDRDPSVGYTNSGMATTQVPGVNAPARPATGERRISSLVEKRTSLFGVKKHHDEAPAAIEDKHGGSKSNLKRFFKFGDHKHKEKEKEKTPQNGAAKDGTRTPPVQQAPAPAAPSVPFADDHGLASKYGKFGKVLGSGAGGSVRLMKRTGDGTVFAVKQFRDRHAYESEKEYNKKVTAEFCIGSTLHHGNVIETIDIVHERGKWYEVMEYAPFDLFATVMTGKMGREETTCATLQILSGVLYLHSMGLAHRDLKLDNVVISDQGIMKLIDFGSAVVFRYPFENDVVLATGVVGSDPYLAPEVYDHSRYDPRPADIWSIAIIFCCMSLRRFPWKAPRVSDNSYRLFVSPPDPDQEKLFDNHRRSIVSSRPGEGATSEPASRNASREESSSGGAPPPEHKHHHTHHHHHHHRHHDSPDAGARSEPATRTTTSSTTATDSAQQPTIKGPTRLLRLLPRETRHIIGRMLELDPKHRATMDEILQDPWVQNSLVCRQEENGVIIKAPNHTHTLQPSGGGGGAK